MPARNAHARRAQCLFAALLLSALTWTHTAFADSVDDADIALQCRFASGLEAIYLVNRARAAVRRVDLLQPRHGRVRSTVAEYRFDFREFSRSYRIAAIIDRGTGNIRRVFGARDDMARMPDPDGGVPGLVYDAGQCREQSGSPRIIRGETGLDRR